MDFNDKSVAEEAIRIEQQVIEEHVGSQDQIWAAYGGINRIDFHKNGGFEVKPANISSARQEELLGHLLLYFTGLSRFASEIAKKQIDNIDNRKKHLNSMAGMVDEALSILQSDSHSLREIGELLHESWFLKRELADNVTTPEVDDFYQAARDAGADHVAHRLAKRPTERLAECLAYRVTERIPKAFGHDWMEDVQVLAPIYKGACGVDILNVRLREALGVGGQQLERGDKVWRLGDRVIQTRNDYEKEIFNGDLGRIVQVDEKDGLVVRFPERDAGYALAELGDLSPAYAITVHRSQGGEYPVVVLPMVTQHHMMLQRNLLYTAITRARALVVVVGSRRAMERAINNTEQAERTSYLAERLRDLGVQRKLNPLPELIRGKRIVVVDDSIVRGTTTPHVISLLRKGGAREIHMRICAPPIMWPCHFGVDLATRRELLAANLSVEEIRVLVGADSLGFLSHEGLLRAVELPKNNICMGCFTGKYPIPVQLEMDKLVLEV